MDEDRSVTQMITAKAAALARKMSADAAVKEIGNAQDTAIAKVNQAQSTAVSAVQQAGNTQYAAIEAKGVETLATIPDDYTTMYEQVQENKADILVQSPAITPTVSGDLVTIEDGADRPAVSLVTHIEPVQEGEGDPSPDNVRPISGWDSVTAQRVGKNLLSQPFTVGAYSGGEYNVNFTSVIATRAIMMKAGTYTLTCASVDGWLLYVVGMQDDVHTNGQQAAYRDQRQFIIQKDGLYAIQCSNPAAVDVTDDLLAKINSTAQLEWGGVATDYEPYQGQTLTADLPETVYGGNLDWNTGVLTVKNGFVSFDGTENWMFETWNSKGYLRLLLGECETGVGVSSHLVHTNTPSVHLLDNANFCVATPSVFVANKIGEQTFEDAETFKTYLANEYNAGTPLQICYELAEPYTIQLTPQQLETLKGTNNVWSDTGSTDLTYIADTQLYIDNKFNELNSALLSTGANV